MDLSTPYLGLKLSHPLMAGASPMTADLDLVRRLEDAGSSAIVMHSLFEEQIVGGQFAREYFTDAHSPVRPETQAYLPDPEEYALGPEEYLRQIGRIKAAVAVPVIASLNGTTRGGWLNHARLIEQAGADAVELNLYSVPTDPDERGHLIEERASDIVRVVKGTVRIPVAVKLSPFYTSLPHFCRSLEQAGADGLVLFNRFYQPDVDPENLDVTRTLHLSYSTELLPRLRWLAILSGQVKASLAVSGGVHTGIDAIKALMCGASGVQMVSALLRHGPEYLREVKIDLIRWMEKHEYATLDPIRGVLSLERCPNPAAFERGNYLHILQHWRGVCGRREHGGESCFE